MRLISLDEAKLLDTMGVAVFWKDTPSEQWCPIYPHSIRPGDAGDEYRIWGVQVDEQ